MAVDAAPQPTTPPKFSAVYVVATEAAAGVAVALVVSGFRITPASGTAGPGQPPRFVIESADPYTRARAAGLSEREMEVLTRIARGLSNPEIGADMHLAVDTVKSHCRRLFRKLDVGDRAHAVAIGYERGLLGQAAA